MKTIVLAASLLFLPTIALADFVADCKTAYVQSDLGVRVNSLIGASTDYSKAEKPFASRCECISQSVKNDFDEELLLNFIQYNGRIYGTSAREKIRASRIVNQCENSISNQERNNYVKKAQSQKEICMSSFIQNAKGSTQDKSDAMKDYKYAVAHNGNWTVAQNSDARGIAIDAFSACY